MSRRQYYNTSHEYRVPGCITSHKFAKGGMACDGANARKAQRTHSPGRRAAEARGSSGRMGVGVAACVFTACEVGCRVQLPQSLSRIPGRTAAGGHTAAQRSVRGRGEFVGTPALSVWSRTSGGGVASSFHSRSAWRTGTQRTQLAALGSGDTAAEVGQVRTIYGRRGTSRPASTVARARARQRGVTQRGLSQHSRGWWVLFGGGVVGAVWG